MAIRDIIKAENVVAAQLATSVFRLSRDGFISGLLNGDLTDEMYAATRALEDFVSEENNRELRLNEGSGNNRFTLNVGLPNTNEYPTIAVLGIAPGTISFERGSRRLVIKWLLYISLGTFNAVAIYPDFKSGMADIYGDLEAAHKLLESKLKNDNDLNSSEIQGSIKDRRRPETLEDDLKKRLLSSPSSGIEL